MKRIPNRFNIVTKDPCIEVKATTLRKAKWVADKLVKFYDTEVQVIDSLTGVVQYIYYKYVDNKVAKV